MPTFPAPASLRSAGAYGSFVNASTAPGTGNGGLRDFPSPNDLELPAKFASFRSVQIEALKRILASEKKWILLQAPTGSGKTLIAAAVQKLLRTRMLYTCHSRDLQDQFIRDFPYAVELKGRENYPTGQHYKSFPHIHCGLCARKKDDPRCQWCCPPKCLDESPCLSTGRCETGWQRCPYEEQKMRAIKAPIAVLNFAMFLTEANYAGGFSGFPLVVCDEADLLESALMGFAELSISNRTLDGLGIEPPKHKTKKDEWVEWAREVAIPAISAKLASADQDGWSTLSPAEVRELREMERLKSKLEFFARQVGTGKWVSCTEEVGEDEAAPEAIAGGVTKWTWKPVYVSDLADRYLWRHGERFLLMSATILEPKVFARNLGIPEGEWEFIDLPSTFPKENRPVYYIPCANMTQKSAGKEWPRVVEALDEVLELHPDQKVLVHTVSYALARYVVVYSRHKDRMVKYDAAGERAEVLGLFKESQEPLVLVAPSMERGVSLDDDLCRIIVILKVPYRNLGDRQVAARLYGARDGRAWYSVDAVRTIVQMSGRGVRHEEDWVITYILDAQFGRLYKEWKKAFPGWWREALKTTKLNLLEEEELLCLRKTNR